MSSNSPDGKLQAINILDVGSNRAQGMSGSRVDDNIHIAVWEDDRTASYIHRQLTSTSPAAVLAAAFELAAVKPQQYRSTSAVCQ